jgi:hypothetical protein
MVRLSEQLTRYQLPTEFVHTVGSRRGVSLNRDHCGGCLFADEIVDGQGFPLTPNGVTLRALFQGVRCGLRC